ncbi:helix-turn-helix domain-containing protein [Flagellimonas meishanensis]|uniref:helix-turn-helix domain-containing protein n=1 Tax=Flagellimonas meishanensis TaxID=2873264 RepID=UPI001CA79A4A|nr:helix-turn-helix domain-containing protein [[Muricauda] meishanensis]
MAFLILFSKKGKKEAKWLWFAFMFLFSYHIFYSVMYWSEIIPELNRKLNYVYFIPLALYGPLFFIYNQMVTGNWKPKPWRILLLLTPLIFVFCFYGKYFFLSEYFRRQFQSRQELHEYLVVAPEQMENILVGCLLFFAVISWLNYYSRIRGKMRKDRWFLYLNVFFMGFSLSWALYAVLARTDILTSRQDYIITIAMALLVALQGYLVRETPEVLINWNKLKNLKLFIKYSKTGMSDSVSLEYRKKLMNLMEFEKPYLNPELKLDDLAQMLGISRHHTSQVINQHFDKGFFDFINEYRIEEAKSILINDKMADEDPNIIEILYAVGFNNKASFYKAFKKFVGTSPTNYINDTLETA